MPHTINLRSYAKSLNIADGKTILEQALEEGIDYPCGCKSGNCGACKSELYSGEVELAPYSEFALTEEEKKQNLILACRAIPLSDCELSPLGQDEVINHPHRSMNSKISEVIKSTHDIYIVRTQIALGEIYDFSPGQYSSLQFDGMPPRDFSMANLPGKNELEFHIRQVVDGKVSNHILSNLKIGDNVQVDGPYGVSYLRESHSGPIIALAGSTGLAPIKCIVESALKKGMKQGIYLYFGVRTPGDLYLEEELKALSDMHSNLTYVPVMSETSGGGAYRAGLVADAVVSDFGDLDGCKSYIAGPPIMVEDAVQKFELLGMRREDCHADAFYTEADKAKLDTTEQ